MSKTSSSWCTSEKKKEIETHLSRGCMLCVATCKCISQGRGKMVELGNLGNFLESD